MKQASKTRTARIDHSRETDRSPEATIRRPIYWAGMCQALRTAVQLDLPDLMAFGARSVYDLVHAPGAHEDALKRLLRALSAVGFCAETQDDVFSLQAWSASTRPSA